MRILTLGSLTTEDAQQLIIEITKRQKGNGYR